MDYRRRTDPVDTAYREAVGRLKILLAESYTVGKRPFRDESGDDTDNQSLLSSRSRHSHHHRTSPLVSRRYPYYTAPIKTFHSTYVPLSTTQQTNAAETDKYLKKYIAFSKNMNEIYFTGLGKKSKMKNGTKNRIQK